MKMRLLHDNLGTLSIAAAAITAAVCWMGVELPHQPTPRPLPPEKWNLPALDETNSKQAIDTINTRNLWGVTVAAEAPKPPDWNVVGITTTGSERLVLVAYENKPVATLRVGDTLPDETKIVEIEKDRFFVMTPKKKKLAYGLFKNDKAK